MENEGKVREATRLLAAAATPVRIILFGSHARGDARPDSDLDFLVIVSSLRSRRAETARLLDILARHHIAADVVVTSQAFFEHWKDVPGTVVFEAAREGSVVFEAA